MQELAALRRRTGHQGPCPAKTPVHKLTNNIEKIAEKHYELFAQKLLIHFNSL